jgi:diguanylate cyclase (GGDEF)-like protein
MAELAAQQEDERLCALARYDVLDTPSEEVFDRITRMVRNVLDVPLSTVTFLDAHREGCQSRPGLGETGSSTAFCDSTIRAGRPLVVPDTLSDPHFANDPLVTGAPFIRAYAGIPLRTPDGHAIGTLCAMDDKPRAFSAEQIGVLEDLAHFAVNELELRRLATTDCLTGALSRRAFRDEAGRAVGLALRHGHDLTCVVFDLDHFKSVNDTFGHGFGDTVLKDSVSTCRELLRTTDLLGRIGGEEFGIILPHTGRKAALDVAEKLREAVARQEWQIGETTWRVTASFGLAALDKSLRDFEALLARADSALYSAKAEGRNRSVALRPVEPERATVRRRVLKAGRISFNSGHSSIDCTVRSLSETGAGIDVFTAAGIPKNFDLVIDADQLVRSCHVVDQTEKHLEIRFG